MKIFVAVSVFLLAGVNQIYAQALSVNNDSIQLSTVEEKYYEDYLKLHPAEATNFGDNRYNDRLYNDLSDSFRAASRRLYQGTLTSLDSINLTALNSQDVVSYDILKKELALKLEKLSLGDSLLVFNQMEGLPQDLALYGSGSVIQPFKTVRDYDNWLKRASIFPEWCDSAIIFLRKGISAKIVHPKVIVEKMILQLEGLISPDPTQSTFYGPVNLFPDSFSVAEKRRLTKEYTRLIIALINPSYKKLAGFLKKDYLPKARGTSGYVSLPGGSEMYNYYLRFSTTTNKTADEIFNLGKAEVARIESEMNKVKKKVGYNGDLKSFFKYVGTDPKFFPFKTPQQVLDAYNAVLLKITPNLGKLFKNKPKTPFEIRQTEAFRASTASIEYYQG